MTTDDRRQINDQDHHNHFAADGIRRFVYRSDRRQAPRFEVQLVTREFGSDEQAIASRSERVTLFWERLRSSLSPGAPDSHYNPPPLGNFSDRKVFEKQTQVLKQIASREDCVVVGWAGVFLLPRHRGMFSAFCHAPRTFRTKRIMNIYQDLTEEKARALITESDRTRAIYFNEMTGHDWTCAKNYNLSIDTSLEPLEEIAELIIKLSKKQWRAAAAIA